MWVVPDNLDDVELTDEQKTLKERLTELETRFAIALATGARTYAEAYALAGGSSKRIYHSKHGAHIWGSPKVKALYYSLIKYPIAAALLQREETLEMLTKMSKVRVTDVCTFEDVEIGIDEFEIPITERHWKLRDLDALPDHVTQAIKSITQTKFGPKVELIDRADAIKQVRAMQGWDASSKHDITSGGKALAPAIIERRIIDPKAEADE